MPLSKNKIKYIRSLELKKHRKEEQVFIAEGHKSVGDLLASMKCRLIVATKEWLHEHPTPNASEIIEVTEEELTRASLQKHPQQVIGVFEQPYYHLDPVFVEQSLCLVLDGIQDPGNLGTIVRIADWFGIEHIVCSPDTADIYNPKTVQATMGAIARVKVHYTPLETFMQQLHRHTPVYGTFLDGKNMYEESLTANGLIVMGNEGNGVSKEVAQLINRKLYIPNYPAGRETSESLNVAVATAITCAEFRRRTM